MGKVESIERHVRDLSAEELQDFRKWFEQFDSDAWDSELKGDVEQGHLDELADRALEDHDKGKSREL